MDLGKTLNVMRLVYCFVKHARVHYDAHPSLLHLLQVHVKVSLHKLTEGPETPVSKTII